MLRAALQPLRYLPARAALSRSAAPAFCGRTPANLPTKRPLVSLMKQARAFGGASS
jgi:hypothetical protein